MEQLITPVGRIVQGSLFIPNTKDAEGRPLVDRQNNPRVNYFIALAVEKTNPSMTELLNNMQVSAAQAWPTGEAKQAVFSWKIVDGDTKPDKEGFKGCWILKFSSSFAPKVYENGGTTLITNPDQIKRGDYVRVAGSYVSNKSGQRPGMYLNLSMVEFQGFGEAIQSGPTGDVFNKVQAGAIPEGMSTTPQPTPGGTFGQQQPMQQQPAQQQPMQQQPAQQQPMQQQPMQQQFTQQQPAQQEAGTDDVPDFTFLSQ